MKGVYFSNDIDVTDAAYADATDTPEPGGLEPEFVVEILRRLGKEIGLIGGDVMEVTPPLQRTPESATRTVWFAVRYFREHGPLARRGGPRAAAVAEAIDYR